MMRSCYLHRSLPWFLYMFYMVFSRDRSLNADFSCIINFSSFMAAISFFKAAFSV